MVPSPSHHADAPQIGHVHLHGHDAETPHPAQPPRWSILRMTVAGRLALAALLGASLWAAVLAAMR